MSKRKSGSEEERWKKKIRKYQEKLRKSSRVIYSSDEEIVQDTPQNLPAVDLDLDELLGEPAEAQGGPQPAARDPEPVPGPSSAPEPTEPVSQVDVDATLGPKQPEPELIDSDLLQALGDFAPEAAEWGEEINDNLSKILTPILRDGLKKEVRDDFTNKYLLPQNCPLTKSPVLNAEIAAVLSENAKSRDCRISRKQKQLGRVLSILGKIITEMLKKSIDTHSSLKLLSDASKLVADCHFAETETRRALITPMLEKSFIDPFKERKRDLNLFGDNLSEFIKSSTGIKRTGQLIQAPLTSTSNLNGRGPPPRYFQRNTRTLLNRSGGPRAPPPPQTSARRRSPAPPPRRAYAPPPTTSRRTSAPPARPARRPYYTTPASHRR